MRTFLSLEALAGSAFIVAADAPSWVGQIMDDIDAHGIPNPWQDFGQALSRHGALSTRIVAEVAACREGFDRKSLVLDLYRSMDENIAGAINLIAITMEEYDATGMWQRLDKTLALMPMEELRKALHPALGLHPYPVVLESLSFNWRYMKEHGVRGFYEMTVDYLGRIRQSTQEAKDLFSSEMAGAAVRHNWLVVSDLRNIEVPTHCDACRMSVTPVLLAERLCIFKG